MTLPSSDTGELNAATVFLARVQQEEVRIRSELHGNEARIVAARTAMEAAAFRDDGSHATRKAFAHARLKVDALEVRGTILSRQLTDVEDERRQAHACLESAQAALTATQRAQAIAELQHAADPSTVRANMAPAFRSLFCHYDALLDAAHQIDALYAEACDAEKQLRDVYGEQVPDRSTRSLLGPLVRRALDRHPERAKGMLARAPPRAARSHPPRARDS